MYMYIYHQLECRLITYYNNGWFAFCSVSLYFQSSVIASLESGNPTEELYTALGQLNTHLQSVSCGCVIESSDGEVSVTCVA